MIELAIDDKRHQSVDEYLLCVQRVVGVRRID
jgi:hypothetical protein